MSHFLDRMLSLVFPERCPACQDRGAQGNTAPICSPCWHSMIPYSGPRCSICGQPMPSDAALTCQDCLVHRPAFEKAFSFGLYEGVLRKAINCFKYHGIKRLSRPLSDIILQLKMPPADGVIPVPLHENRLRQREFNQSALLARNISRETGGTLMIDCLVRTKDTPPQVGLTSAERVKNIGKAFLVTKRETIAERNILLVDDVYTTGATVRECSRLLKRAGAKNVYVVTLAHNARN